MPTENEISLLYNMMKNRWTNSEIEIISNNWKGKTNSELAELIPRHSRDAIARKMKRIGIFLSKEDISWRAKYAHSFIDYDNKCKTDQHLNLDNLDNIVFQVLIGSMLGDGCVNKQSKNLRNYRFCEGHGLKQSDYVYWKANILSIFKPRISNCKNHTSLITKTNPIFTFLRNNFYNLPINCQKSKIPIDLVSNIDLFGLMVWYLDDGNLSKKSWNLTIGAMGWDDNDLADLSNLINLKFNLSTYVYKCRHKNGTNKILKFPFKDRLILNDWKNIAFIHKIPKCMFYKFEKEVQHSH